METPNSFESSSKNYFKNLKFALPLFLALTFSCKGPGDTNSQNSSQETEGISQQTHLPNFQQKMEKIGEPWEIKVHKLNLNSICDVKRDFALAKVKVEKTTALKALLSSKDMSIDLILPLIIKESRMNNQSQSASGAQGYGQLKDDAIQQIRSVYGNLGLDKENGVDNLILCCLYRKYLTEKTKNILDKQDVSYTGSDLYSFTNFSYNAGDTRLRNLLKESHQKNLTAFIKYLITRKLSLSYKPTKSIDPTYKVEYIDLFSGAKLSEKSSRETKKIYEACRYIQVIDGLKNHLTSNSEIITIGTLRVDESHTLYSLVKQGREEGLFHSKANINEICEIILNSNGYKDKGIPKQAVFILDASLLKQYLTTTSFSNE